MSELVFYTHPQSRGRIVHWMLEELGEPYQTAWLEYGSTMTICAYLADRFPQRRLAPPPGDRARAAYYRWMFFTAGPLEMATTAKALGWQVPEGRNRMVGFGTYGSAIDALETALRPGPFVCGEQFTAADVVLGSALAWGMMFGTIDKRPGFEAYVARLQRREAAQRANRLNEARLQAGPTA